MKKTAVKRKLSVLKRQRQAIEANAHNRARRSRARTFVKKFEKTMLLVGRGQSSSEQLKELFPVVQSELARAGQKGVFHVKAMSRKIKRLHVRLNRMLVSAPHATTAS